MNRTTTVVCDCNVTFRKQQLISVIASRHQVQDNVGFRLQIVWVAPQQAVHLPVKRMTNCKHQLSP